jgi:LPS export ABC transporter protein LptC
MMPFIKILISFFLIWSCTRPGVDVDLLEEFDPNLEIAYQMETLYSDSAYVRAKITAGKMTKFLDRINPYDEFTQGVIVEFFDIDQNLTARLTGKNALRLEGQGLIYVRDSVVWQNMEGEKLETSELIWDDRNRRIFTKKFCVITRPGETILSQGFEANQDFSDIRFFAIEGKLQNRFTEE